MDEEDEDKCYKCLFTPDGCHCRKDYMIWGCNDDVCHDYIGGTSIRGEELIAEGFDPSSNEDVPDFFGL